MLILNFFTETIGKAIVSLLLLLDSFIYSLVDWTYQIILILANTNILQNTTTVSDLIKRMYVILGVIMMFLIAYSLLKGMVNPNEALKDKKSPVNLIKNVIISIVLIALVPTIFDFAYGFQNALLTENTIGKIILGSSSSEITNENGESASAGDILASGGREMAAGVLLAFLHPDYTGDKCTNNNDGSYDCSSIVISSEDGDVGFNEFWEQNVINGSLLNITSLNDNIVEGEVTYIFIISTLGGIVIMLVLLMYCFDIAIRAVKLSVFEIIAPITILARLIPGEQGKKTFDNWVKACLTTFVEVFIRIALLFFAILIIKIVVLNFPNYFNAVTQGGGNIILRLFAQAFIIIGIVLFLRQAPQIIKDITGLDSGKFNPLKSALGAAALLGGSAQAFANRLNATDDNGNKLPRKRRILSAFGGAASAGLHGFRNLDNVKDRKSMNEARKNAAQHAAERKAQKDNEELSRDQWIKQENARRTKNGEEKLGKFEGSRKYKAAVRKQKFQEWAGVGDYDSARATQTRNLASKVSNDFSALEKTWKGSHSYEEAKAKADAAKDAFAVIENEFNEHMNQYKEQNGIKFDENTTDAEKRSVRDAAMATFAKRTEYETKRIAKDETSAKKDNRVHEDRGKKADVIADNASSILYQIENNPNVGLKMENVLQRFDEKDRKFAEDAYNRFKDVSADGQVGIDAKNDLETCLKADINSNKYKMADMFMEYLDKQDKEMKAILRGVEAQEQRRMDSLGTDKKDSN